jgi:glutaredoxin 3
MSTSETTQPVIIYSTTWCAFCKRAKSYFDSKGVAYVDKDVEQDAEAYKELMAKIDGNFQGVPVIDIKGSIVLGFDQPKIDAALAV